MEKVEAKCPILQFLVCNVMVKSKENAHLGGGSCLSKEPAQHWGPDRTESSFPSKWTRGSF